MFEEQETVAVEREEILGRVRNLFNEGYRLVQMSCTKLDRFQVDYTFDKAYRFFNLRVTLAEGDAALPSITPSYACAFTYENEIRDLFGVQFEGIGIDYGGNFYRVGVKAPFSRPDTAEEE
ncbi:MAG: NADH-quinone oxidoreductase subunit C [Desulfobacteraceae bacterium]|nr:MAG: NADH-quinone oxidoreductase subunit C [Desulfobacteraceae bacterium]